MPPEFSKDSKEYLSNGHYQINGREFMSVWTDKKTHRFSPTENTTPINSEEGRQLAQVCSEAHSTEPDFGRFSEILVFPVDELKSFYKK